MALSRRALCTTVVIVALAAVFPPSGTAQQANVLVHVAISGEVLPLQLAKVGQAVRQGDPVVFLRGTTSGAAVPGALAPVDGQVVQVMVRPGDRVNIGDVVAVIQPK
jgi:multidrug efflux pump subunit AcrA (membrane-fusion protein)